MYIYIWVLVPESTHAYARYRMHYTGAFFVLDRDVFFVLDRDVLQNNIFAGRVLAPARIMLGPI